MSNQLQITGGAKVRSLEGVITGTTGVLGSLPINGANGIPQLDSSGKILVSQLPNSVMEYLGTWNAATNTPTLVNGTGNAGDVYLCNVAGTTNFGAGPITFFVGDQVIYSGSIWQRASGATGTVTSVAVTESGDALSITGSPITTSGTINIGFAGTSAQYVAGNGSLITFPTLTGYVPYTGATADVNLGAFDLYTSKVWLYDNPNSGYGSMELTDGVLHFEDVDGHSMVTMEDGYLTIANASTIRALLDVSALSANRDYAFPNASGTLALTSDLSGYVPTSRTISTTSPLSGGGALSSNLTLSISQANTSTNGYLSSTDWNTFNNKQSALTFSSPLVNTSGTISIPVATTSVNGYLSSTDWNTFNNKQNALGFTPIGGSGSINYISKFTGSTTISQSGIYEGVTNYVSIGNTNTTYNLDVTGTFRLTGNAIFGGTLGNGTYTYTLPGSTGTLALTSQIPSLSGYVTGTAASGQVPYFTGTSSVAGSNNLFWDTSNLRLGIGTTNPQRSLTIYNATADNHLQIAGAAPSVSLTDTVTGATYQAKFGLATASGQYATGAVAGDFVIISQTGSTIWANSGGERMRLNTSGYVGIGTSSPKTLLDVYYNGDIWHTFIGGGTSKLLIGGQAGSGGVVLQAGNASTANNAAPTTAYNMYLQRDGGYVGIGTSTPQTQLHMNGVLTLTESGYDTVRLHQITHGHSDGSSPNNYIGFRISDGSGTTAERMRINGAGNVGIGTSSPSAQLQVSITSTSQNAAYIEQNAAYNGLAVTSSGNSGTYYIANFRSTGIDRFRILDNGDVIVNSTSTSSGAKFNVFFSDNTSNGQVIRETTGNASVGYLLFNSNGTQTGSITRASSTNAVLYNTTSDYRLKEDYKEINGLEKVAAIKVYDFKWKGINERMDGVIAHELQEVLPYAVSGKKDGENMQGVDYSKIVPILIKAIQELKAEIDELKNK